MIRAVALIFSVMFITASCGEVEDKTNKDNIPDPGLKKLTNIEKNKVSALAGSMGDLSFVIAQLADTNFLAEEDFSNQLDRDPFRNRLKSSMDMKNCDVVKGGTSYNKNYTMKADGRRCRFVLSYRTSSQNKKVGKEDFIRKTEFRREFKGANRQIDSDIYRSNMQGLYTFQKKTTEQNVRFERNANVKMRVTSRKMGVFNYSLEERFIQLTEAETLHLRQEYRRIDRFELGNNLKVTVFKSIENLTSDKEVKAYTINGENISAADYALFMQEMEKQIGMERFNDSTSPSQL